MARQTIKLPVLAIAAPVLGWLVPGAGHLLLRRYKRGIIIFLTIAATFWTAVALGGVMTVDVRREKWWFVAEAFTGVHGLVGAYQSEKLYDRYENFLRQGEDPQYTHLAEPYQRALRELRNRPWGGERETERFKGVLEELKLKFCDKLLAEDGLALVSPVDTVARAYAGVAGLLNLMCIFDVAILGLMGRVGEPKPSSPGKDRTE